MNRTELWQRYRDYLCPCPEVGLTLDISRMLFADSYLDASAASMARAFDATEALEAGAIANPDEDRMVGHYWLRDPKRAPEPAMAEAITACVDKIESFAANVHAGRIAPPSGGRFLNFLLVGIGGSALGPKFVADALAKVDAPMASYFFDNTDPDGMDRTLARLAGTLGETLVVVVSKSGGTKETRNGMLEAANAYRAAGLDFAAHAVAVTSEGSALHRVATEQAWLETFPMWDWVGGRTSQTAAVGLLPAALAGIDIRAMLAGARAMDEITRRRDVRQNPAALLALMWRDAAVHRGLRDMVVIPYKDRLALFSRYLQQLIMESLGKETDLDGNTVHEGITVYGNKGSTDQHAYVQQLREGLHNFYVTFMEVLTDRDGDSIEVDPGVTSGDYLSGFLLGTRDALFEKGRESITITIDAVTPHRVGALIALYERAVGLYASLVNINAYHQPGVEAGKKAAGKVIELQAKVLGALGSQPLSVSEIAIAANAPDECEWTYKILERLAANPTRGVQRSGGSDPVEARFAIKRMG